MGAKVHPAPIVPSPLGGGGRGGDRQIGSDDGPMKQAPAAQGDDSSDLPPIKFVEEICTLCGGPISQCYVRPSHYLLGWGVWMSIMVASAMWAGIVFGLAYWRFGLERGQAWLLSYAVLVDIIISCFIAVFVPFSFAPAAMRVLFRNRTRAGRFVKPILPVYISRGCWRVFPALRWPNVLFVNLYVAAMNLLFFGLPLVGALAIVTDGGTRAMSAMEWATIDAAWSGTL